jgi:hypothetical protein
MTKNKRKLTVLEKALIRPNFLNALGTARQRRVGQPVIKKGKDAR